MAGTDKIVNLETLRRAASGFGKEGPFDHVVVDGFLHHEVALALEAEFPAFEDPVWHQYRNAIELKKVSNDWNRFPELTYRTFDYLNGPGFTRLLGDLLLGGLTLHSDPGLHGGGWHIHGAGGKLNTHLD